MFYKFLSFFLTSICLTYHSYSLDLSAHPTSWSQQKSLSNQEFVEYEAPNGIKDPLKPLNKAIFVFNRLIDGLFLKPWSHLCHDVVPDSLRRGVRNFLDNLYTPLSTINYILQGQPEQATITLLRFGINTTMGLLGTMDAASELNIKGTHTGFAETLEVWGVKDGPYLMSPLLGPTTFRGFVGLFVDFYTDPFTCYALPKKKKLRHKRQWMFYTRNSLDILSRREQLLKDIEDLETQSLDFYSAAKSVYIQKIHARFEQIQERRQEIKAEREVVYH